MKSSKKLYNDFVNKELKNIIIYNKEYEMDLYQLGPRTIHRV